MGSINNLLIQELVEDCQRKKDSYCLLREIVKASNIDIEDYLNEESHNEIGLIFEKNKLIEDILEDYCPGKDINCEFKAIVIKLGLDTKSIKQMKCIETYKYNENKRRNINMNWDDGFKEWVERGFAADFNKLYDKKDEAGKEIKSRDLYVSITGDKDAIINDKRGNNIH
jgi:hypothetical protein